MEKSLKHFDERINQILENRTNKKKALEEKLEAAKLIKNDAQQRMEEAAANEDTEAYKTAKENRRNAEDDIEMYLINIAALDSVPLLTKEDKEAYEEGCEQLIAAMDEINKTAIKKCLVLCNKLETIKLEVNQNINEVNELLNRWQHLVYNDAAVVTTATGAKVHLDSLEKKYKDYRIVDFIDYVLNSSAYIKIKKEWQ